MVDSSQKSGIPSEWEPTDYNGSQRDLSPTRVLEPVKGGQKPEWMNQNIEEPDTTPLSITSHSHFLHFFIQTKTLNVQRKLLSFLSFDLN